ncbi:hypothetical protein G3580_05860 [Nitrogeniibacter mangrovi]|uniref:Uncharacterized protein n=1 Tax=Nitrogeniibacter mangrovi TaxID=2016596 RepID=A0A6C1B2J9_9RHOO|nr:hypothetical protein [Nitrogeniibacter mangrovi]QID17209.1 hypothetical protein G3580_05860 [Nitrogeniibacter mangrovi]
MQALSFEQAPPPSVPLRFFLTAPAFLMLAGVLLMVSGREVFASRWTPAALALTHLLTVGFMLQVMLGALFQIMPVAIGANLPALGRLARAVHVAVTFGAVLLVGGFYWGLGGLLVPGGALILGAVAVFCVVALRALWHTPVHSGTVVALRWAIAWLGATVGLGFTMALARSGHADVAVLGWSSVHVAVGLGGWGGLLVAGTAYLVVPMFQLTPAYPTWFVRGFAPAVALALIAGSALDSAYGWLPLLAVASAFALMTLDRQRRRRRARADTTLRLWRLAMGCVVAGSVAGAIASLRHWPETALMSGGVVLWGAYVSLIVGMLYKIVPFVLWLHLQPRLANVPPMTRMLDDALIRWHWRAHLLALGLLLISPLQSSAGLVAGAVVTISAALLALQLVGVTRQARRALARAQAS